MSKIKKQKNKGGCTPRKLSNTNTNLFQVEVASPGAKLKQIVTRKLKLVICKQTKKTVNQQCTYAQTDYVPREQRFLSCVLLTSQPLSNSARPVRKKTARVKTF